MAVATKNPAAQLDSGADTERGAQAHRYASELFERYYDRSVTALATALGTTRDTARSWLGAAPGKPREALLDRAVRLWILCRTGSRYIFGGDKVGQWTLAPHLGLQGKSPAETLLEDGERGLERLLNEMVSYAPARPDLPLESDEEELRTSLRESLGPETAARLDAILEAPELEVTDEDLAELAAFDD